jgi:hypothetical protein
VTLCSCCAAACCCRCVLLQTLNSENMEDYVGYELPAKFLEVDEVRPALRSEGRQQDSACMQMDRQHRRGERVHSTGRSKSERARQTNGSHVHNERPGCVPVCGQLRVLCHGCTSPQSADTLMHAGCTASMTAALSLCCVGCSCAAVRSGCWPALSVYCSTQTLCTC